MLQETHITKEQLKSYIERIERLEEEKAALGKGERNSSVNRALTAQEAEGKLIHRKTGVQNANVIYEWNKDWKPWCVGDSMDTTRAISDGQYDGISPDMVNPQRKFTVGSAWQS